MLNHTSYCQMICNQVETESIAYSKTGLIDFFGLTVFQTTAEISHNHTKHLVPLYLYEK